MRLSLRRLAGRLGHADVLAPLGVPLLEVLPQRHQVGQLPEDFLEARTERVGIAGGGELGEAGLEGGPALTRRYQCIAVSRKSRSPALRRGPVDAREDA